jgi:hypothetical protein
MKNFTHGKYRYPGIDNQATGQDESLARRLENYVVIIIY